MTTTSKSWTVAVAVGVIVLFYGYGYINLLGQNCEVIPLDLPQEDSKGPTLSQREDVFIICDRDVISYRKTKRMALAMFDRKSCSLIGFLDDQTYHILDTSRPMELFLIGKNDHLMDQREDGCYVLFPAHFAPEKGNRFPTAILVDGQKSSGQLNQSWRKWCEQYGVPYVESKSMQNQDVQLGIEEMQKAVVDRFYSHGKGGKVKLN